jgi:hypothetical protein
MAIIDLTPVPNSVVMGLQGNTGIFESPLTGSFQTVDRGGYHWDIAYTYTELYGADRAVLMGMLAESRSQANRIRVPVHDNPKRGLYGGTPVVNGASQTGSSINIDGCSNNITNWIRAGDYLSIDVNGEHELKMCTADANTNGTGQITINFEPRLRFSPLNNAAVYVEDGTLPKPRGIFVLKNSANNWSSRPAPDNQGRTAMNLAMIEDMFATQ